eukprot:TRINITY_DN1672_c1_g1_i2.p1 TRINITY_DN1672_c1_g1~~TRINITY_DN1672_c1_g1_i2.p1  ORF type:complete len:345 (+),score=125.76 TRINITY_DN1672_c1_g1_i2:51-1085(+)
MCIPMRLVALSAAAWCAGATVIRPEFDKQAAHWLDTNGDRIEAHAAGMLQNPLDGRWYWYGESKKTKDLATHGVTCYSAATVAGPWTNHGLVITQESITAPKPGPYVVERPKVIFNNATGKFVMWFHLDGHDAGSPLMYSYRYAAVAVADSPTDKFDFVHALQPDGIPSLDMSLFLDPLDGQAYFIRSCNNSYVGISRMTKDFLNTTGVISTHDKFEGMAIFRLLNGTYYMVTSHLTGWNPNPLMLFRAAGKTLDDPQWVNMGNPTGDKRSFNSQPTYVVRYTPKDASVAPYYIYMADNWVKAGPKGLIDAGYVWLPFNFHADGAVTLEKRSAWDIEKPFSQGE